MKQVYIYGAHVKEAYIKPYESFSDIAHEGMSRSHEGILDLVNQKTNQPFEYVSDGLKNVPYVGSRYLNNYSEYQRGKPKFRGILGLVGFELHDRIMLMNDEVTWQWKTGSDLTYRFESISEAEDFFKWVLKSRLSEVKIISAEKPAHFKFKVGDRVKLLSDITFTEDDLDIESRMFSFGLNFPSEVLFKTGEEVRVFDVCADGFSISPIDKRTAFRIPGTGGGKAIIGSQTCLSWDTAELVREA